MNLLEPDPCACGHGQWVSLTPYYTHQVIELPKIEMEINHFVLQQDECAGCGRVLKAQGPAPIKRAMARASPIVIKGHNSPAWNLPGV
jgi:hypothetical protein